MSDRPYSHVKQHHQLAQAKPSGASAVPCAPDELVPAHLLSGGEIVVLAIKPSLLFVLFRSFRWIVAVALLIALGYSLAGHVGWLNARGMVRFAALLALIPVVVALLQWFSRLYVLTNRRVMRIRGIFNVNVFECPLSRIQNTFLTLALYERVFRLGSIAFATAGTGGVEAVWENIAHPLEIHERVRNAVRRAQNSGGV